jgi:hypothetical protein
VGFVGVGYACFIFIFLFLSKLNCKYRRLFALHRTKTAARVKIPSPQ